MTNINERIARSELHEKQFNAAVEAAFAAHQADELARSVEQAAQAHNRRMLWITLIIVGVIMIYAVLIVAWIML